MSRWIAVFALVAVGCTACSGEAPPTPAGPSATGTAVEGGSSVTQGAKIMGNVSAGVPLAALAEQSVGTSISSPVGFGSAGAPLAAMTAQVVGTSISSPVGAGGGFSLEGVPTGAVHLRFVGPGVDASVALSPVQPGDVVSVLVIVAGTAATVQSESRNAGGKVELEGRIESLTPAALSLIVDGRTVTTDTRTIFRDGNNAAKAFADLAVGQRVHVSGTLGADSVVADSILIQNTDVTLPVNVNGIVESLSGNASAFDFFIGSRKIKGDDKTIFYGDASGLLAFGALHNGVRVEVKGEQRDAHVYAVRIHINGATTPDPPQDDSASVEGRLKGMVGTAPALALTIAATGGDVIVTTTGATEVQRRGDVRALADLAVGQTIHAVGTRQPDKSIVARKLQIMDDETGGAFTIEGSVGGLKGTCPTITFGVNGYTVAASADTKYFPEPAAKCEDLKGGTKVFVEGTRQADGSVKAGTITKK